MANENLRRKNFKKKQLLEEEKEGETMAQDAPKTMLEEKAFIVSDGSRIHDLKELADALESMHQDTFRFHANESKNDFAAWAKDVFSEHQLAEKLSGANSKSDAQIAVLKHLVNKL